MAEIGSKQILLGNYNKIREKVGKIIAQNMPAMNSEEGRDKAIRFMTSFTTAQRFQAEQRAAMDKMTGLHNRGFFDETVKTELERVNRKGGKIGVLIGDVRKFKNYNSEYGALGGDKILTHVGSVLQTIRTTDVPARTGGDEIGVVYPHITQHGENKKMSDKDRLVTAGLRLLKSIHGNAVPMGPQVNERVHMDIGLTLSVPGDTLETTYKRADLASLVAKKTISTGADKLVIVSVIDSEFVFEEASYNEEGALQYHPIPGAKYILTSRGHQNV